MERQIGMLERRAAQPAQLEEEAGTEKEEEGEDGTMGMVMMGTRHGPTRNLPSRIPRKIGCFEGIPGEGMCTPVGGTM